MEDVVTSIWSLPGTAAQHVFTDGSTTRTNTPFEVAAWANANATTGSIIPAGQLIGLPN